MLLRFEFALLLAGWLGLAAAGVAAALALT